MVNAALNVIGVVDVQDGVAPTPQTLVAGGAPVPVNVAVHDGAFSGNMLKLPITLLPAASGALGPCSGCAGPKVSCWPPVVPHPAKLNWLLGAGLITRSPGFPGLFGPPVPLDNNAFPALLAEVQDELPLK